jgi:hypothetical protein
MTRFIFSVVIKTPRLPQVDQTEKFYQLAGVPADNIKYNKITIAGHSIVTEDGPVACSETAPPYINDCDFTQSHRILKHIYGDLNSPLNHSVAKSSNLPKVNLLKTGTRQKIAQRIYRCRLFLILKIFEVSNTLIISRSQRLVSSLYISI